MIDETHLPVVLKTIRPTDRWDVLAHYLSTDQRIAIVSQSQDESSSGPPEIRNAAVELAIAAGQQKTKTRIPDEYRQFANLFSEEESRRFPPRRRCDHAITFKPGVPDSINWRQLVRILARVCAVLCRRLSMVAFSPIEAG